MNSLRSILRFRGKAAGIVAIAITLSSAPASALIVFDPTNYSQNLLQAARALEQIQHQVTSLQNEAQMLINQAKNLTSLPTSLLEQIEGNFSQMKILLGEADKLAYSVQDIDSQFASTYQNFGSDLSSQQLVDGARERWQTSVSAFEHSLKAGAVAADNIEATQAGNQLLAVQAKQIADLTAMLAAQGRASALEQARQAAAQEQAQQQFTRFMAGSGYSPSSVKMFHD
ncbi:MAG: P-type conjugative transfer protein TrbJ [Mesorhizobium sp.]|nr:MAG: P-type conjugative transfer protein TrbJ [Mesorhizobium sp.]